MRLAHFLRLSTLLLVASAAGCGESTPPPASASAATTAAAPTSDALGKSAAKGKRGPISKGRQTVEKRREYNAASPDGPPSKY